MLILEATKFQGIVNIINIHTTQFIFHWRNEIPWGWDVLCEGC